MGTWVVRVVAVVALVGAGVAVYVAGSPFLPGSSAHSSAQGDTTPSGSASGGHQKSGRQQSERLQPGITTHNLNPPVGFTWMTVSTSWVGNSPSGRVEVVTSGARKAQAAQGAVVIRVLNQHTNRPISSRTLHPAGTGALTIIRRVGPDKLQMTAKNGHVYELKISTAKLVQR